MGCHFEVKFFQTQNELESFMPFPRFMLMRGSLRGNGNHSLDNPLEQDQSCCLHQPCPGGMCSFPSGTTPGCITCVLGITHPPTRGFGRAFLFWGESCPPTVLGREKSEGTSLVFLAMESCLLEGNWEMLEHTRPLGCRVWKGCA